MGFLGSSVVKNVPGNAGDAGDTGLIPELERSPGEEMAQFSSVQLSRSVVSDSLRPHELQHARPPCPSPTPGVHSNSHPKVSDTIQPSHPLSSPSPPAPNPSQHQMSQLFT